MGQDIDFNVIARDRASSTFSKVGKTAASSESAIAKFGATAKKVFAAAAIYEGAKLATKGLIGMAKAAADDQVSTALLAKQFRNSADATNKQIAATEAWITKVGIAKGVADDDLRPALGNLVTATHDVSKAQRLTGLAMDVAAAKGKPLAAVSLALAKAYNGSIGGLGRLGIKTKDAAGKALTFAAAQKELVAQFGGAAAAKAKTFTGLMDRFQVMMREAGESIGYKLLPILTKFGDWFLANGVPKIETFVNRAGAAISKFIKDFQDGVGVAGDIKQALETVVTIGKTVISFFNSLPGSVKKFAVEGLIAYGVLSKLRTGFGAFSGGGLSGFVSGMANAETRMATMTSASQKLQTGLKTLAGIGGMLALAQGVKETNQTVGMLETTLGGAAVGFSVGGPWGAAVGGAAGLLYNVFKGSKQAASGLDKFGQTASEQVASVDAFAASLNQATGAFTRLTKQEAAKELLGKGAFTNADKLGLSYATVTKAALGNEAALKRVNAATGPAIAASKNLVKLNANQYADSKTGAIYTNKQAFALMNQAKAAEVVAKAIGGVNRNVREGKAQVLSLALAQGKYSKSLAGIPNKKILKIGTEGHKEALADIIDLQRHGKGLTDKQLKMLFKVADLPEALRDIGKIKSAADKASKNRTFTITVKKVGDYLFGPGSTPSSPGKPKPSKPAPHHNPVGPSTRESVSRVIAGNTAVADSVTKVATAAKDTKKHVKELTASMVKNQPAVKAAIDKIGRQFDRAKNKASAFKDKVSNLTDQLNALKDVKAGFVSTFSADSIFGADMETSGKSLDSLMSFASAQRDKAQQLLSDIQTSLGKGLSKGLAAQLQAAGSAGAQQLHLLASATSAQIQQFNALDAQTSAADTAGGLLLGNYVRGGSINNDIASKAADVKIAQAQLAAQNAQVKAIQHLEERIAIALGKVGKDAGHEVAEVLGVAVKQANSKGGTHR